jgi:hypothetical protein
MISIIWITIITIITTKQNNKIITVTLVNNNSGGSLTSCHYGCEQMYYWCYMSYSTTTLLLHNEWLLVSTTKIQELFQLDKSDVVVVVRVIAYCLIFNGITSIILLFTSHY